MSGGGLPQFAVLKCMSDNRYVQCKADGSIIANSNDVLSPHCKFELERAETLDNFFNIRSCYNNKYWVAEGPDNSCLKAGAAKPDEDESNWNCTLFRFRHPYAYSARDSTYLRFEYDSIVVGGSCRNIFAEFTVIDWESLVILPKHVTFKTYYGKYLEARWIEGHQYHRFSSNDPRDLRAAYEIFPTGDGNVRIKSSYFKKYWRRSPNWIWADDSSDNSYNDNEDTLFAPLKFGNNNSSSALRNLGNNNFCVPLSKECKENCLNADVGSVSREAIFTVEEAVLSREITNVRYRLMHARIYDESILTMVNREAVNYSSVPETVTMKLSYTQGTKKTWERGVSASLTVSTSIKAGVPIIAGGKVNVSGTVGGHMKWGDTTESSKLVETTQTVTVPPWTRVKTSLLATEATCDVPFSYTQRDALPDGRVVIYDMDDGLFTGINTYNFRFETTEQKL